MTPPPRPLRGPGHQESVSDPLFEILSSPDESMFKRMTVFFLEVTTATKAM